MKKTINEAQLNGIISESVKKVLKEYYDTHFSENPGNVKNPKVAELGREAQTNVRGHALKNDSDFSVEMKHSGGRNRPINGLYDIFNDATKGDESAQKTFFKAMKNNKDLSREILILLSEYSFKAHNPQK